jgi:hypothetical protein
MESFMKKSGGLAVSCKSPVTKLCMGEVRNCVVWPPSHAMSIAAASAEFWFTRFV